LVLVAVIVAVLAIVAIPRMTGLTETAKISEN